MTLSESECTQLRGMWTKTPEKKNLCLIRQNQIFVNDQKIHNINAYPETKEKTVGYSPYIIQVVTKYGKDVFYPSQKNITKRGEDRVNDADIYEKKISVPLGTWGMGEQIISEKSIKQAVMHNPSDFMYGGLFKDYAENRSIKAIGFQATPLPTPIMIDNRTYKFEIVKSYWECDTTGCNSLDKGTLKLDLSVIKKDIPKIALIPPTRIDVAN